MKKGCLIISLVSLGLICIFFILTIWFFSSVFGDGKSYNKKDLIDNYDKNEEKIANLISYFNSIVPDSIYVDIEINNTNNIDIFHVIKDEHNYGGWNISVDSPKADSIFNLLRWDKEEINTLKRKLDEVNCISINNSYPTLIGFQRSNLSKYDYVIFDSPIAGNDSLMDIYDDKCMYIFYRDNVVLGYGGGVIGPDCFPRRFLE